MSEPEVKRFYTQIATPKYREIVRNIALGTWTIGLALSILAVVILTGTEQVFACLVTFNIVFLLLNCCFCRVNIQTLKKKRAFYLVCLIIMIANVALLVAALTNTSRGMFQIIGIVGCGLLSISCLFLVALFILLNIRGLQDPTATGQQVPPDLPGDLPNGYVEVRYVSMRRGRLNSESTFQAAPGQILSLPNPRDTTTNTEQSAPPSATNNSHVYRLEFREGTQQQGWPNCDRQVPIRIISDGIFGSQRRASSISLLTRASTESFEYDIASVRCICFYLASDSSDDDQVPPYTENPTGNISRCPIHGEHSISPPSYDLDTSSYSSLCSVLGLPKYDDVVVTKSSSASKLSVEKSTCNTFSLVTSTTAQVMRRSSTAPALFETIIEDGSETASSSSALPGDISEESADTTDVPLTMITRESSVSTD